MDAPTTPYALVLTTAGTEEEAQRIARALVEDRLAACVNVAPKITSVYRWKGTVLTETEWLLLIKTRRDLFPRVQETVRRLHSYELPELLLIPVHAGEENYLRWLAEGTSAEKA
jgi:periplasmic divalent cation tolerance protein